MGISKSLFLKIFLQLLLLYSCTGFSEQVWAQNQGLEDEDIIKFALVICPKLTEIIGSEEGFEKLTNPTLTSVEEVQEALSSYYEIYRCLAVIDSLVPLPIELDIIKILVEYFLIFAPYERIDLGSSSDPAIIRLREEVGLPAPKGFVYLRRFQNKRFMPETIRPTFKSEDTRAVTILSRYIAVLSEPAGNSAQKLMEQKLLHKTVSHELVHAYINSILGFSNQSKLPIWFHEACAVYFSGSGGAYSTVIFSGDYAFSYVYYDPKEYRGYKLVFLYLEKKIGRENLCKLVKYSIEQQTVDNIFSAAGVVSYEELLKESNKWNTTKEGIKWGIAIFVLIFFLLLFMRMFPKYRKPFDIESYT